MRSGAPSPVGWERWADGAMQGQAQLCYGAQKIQHCLLVALRRLLMPGSRDRVPPFTPLLWDGVLRVVGTARRCYRDRGLRTARIFPLFPPPQKN